MKPEFIVLRNLQPGDWTIWDDFSMDGPGPTSFSVSYLICRDWPKSAVYSLRTTVGRKALGNSHC